MFKITLVRFVVFAYNISKFWFGPHQCGDTGAGLGFRANDWEPSLQFDCIIYSYIWQLLYLGIFEKTEEKLYFAFLFLKILEKM